MSVSKQVKEFVDKVGPGTIFGLKDFQKVGNFQAVALELSRLFKKGEIERLTKGKYYVPKHSRFGRLGPDEWQILDKIIKENGGYFAGGMALNRLGVTTQVPSQITIRGARSSRKLKIGHLTILLTKDGNKDADYQQSNLTDVIEGIRLIKKVPNSSIEETLRVVELNLKSRSESEISDLIKLLKNERPYVRAIIGALLEKINYSAAGKIKKTLCPLTKYKIGISSKQIPNRNDWGIS